MIFNLFEAKKTKSESQGRIPGMNGEERVKKSPSYHTRQNSSVDATCASNGLPATISPMA